MTQEDKVKIRELIVTLQRIRNKENVFFNIAQYKRLGLIVERKRYGTNGVGDRVEKGYTYHLTAKAMKYLNVVI